MGALRYEVPDFIQLEMDVAQILQEQEEHGWAFDEEEGWKLATKLKAELAELEQEVRDKYPFVPGGEFTPKRDNSTAGYICGATMTRLKDLNPTSRDHLIWILKTHYRWKPTELTGSGKPILDEKILTEIGTPIAMKFLRMLTITKYLGMLTEGQNAWLKLVTNARRIHHHCSVATNTHRCAHRKPNLSQVPSGDEFRRLFIPSQNHTLVGADLSGIELRCLANYLHPYDGGRYANILLTGDIHQTNADKIGISRKQVKTVTYCFLYGGGVRSIGRAYDMQLSDAEASKKGKEIKDAYIDAIPGLGKFLDDVKRAADRGYIKLIDGRKISVDSGHKAVNYLLQGTAGVIAKRWMVISNNKSHSYASQLGFIHDELQYETIPEHVELLKQTLESSAVEAGEYYNFRIRIDAEAKQGNNWSETH